VITPNVIEIKGPRSQLFGIKILKTLPISVEGVSEDVEGETSVILPEDGTVHAINRSSVQYRLPVVKIQSGSP